MKNSNYWKYLASETDSDLPDILKLDNPVIKEKTARDLFYSGVVYYMADTEPDRARKFLTASARLFVNIEQNYTDSSIRTMRFFISWMIDNSYQNYLIKSAQFLKQEEIYRGMLLADAKNLGIYFYKAISMKNGIGPGELTKSIADNMYEYKKLADELMGYYRLMLMFSGINKEDDFERVMKTSLELYNQSLEKAEKSIAVMKDEWRIFENQSIEKIREYRNPLSIGYLKEWELITRPILFSLEKAKILQFFFTDLFKSKSDSLRYRRMIEEFFQSYVNPPNKKTSFMGLLEELQWAYLFHYYDIRMNPTSGNIKPKAVLDRILG